jgi:hypothetical protein
MHVQAKTLRRAGAIGIVGLLLCALAATSAQAASWRGNAYGKIVRSNRLVSGGTTWHGDFWFKTNRDGKISGHAIVAYEPNVDVSGLTNAIGYVKTTTGAALGLLGPFGTAASAAGLGQIVGASVSFDSAMAVREGELAGVLHQGRLNLRWKAHPQGIPYDIALQLVSGSERIGGGRAALANPVQGDAKPAGRRNFVYADETRSNADGVKELVGSYYVAHRAR